MDDLFAAHREARQAEIAPLATRMRPQTLDEIAGQAHLVAPGSAFRTMVEAGRPVSMILWGPPGTGKTTLARLVAAQSEAHFVQLSATSAGVKDVRDVLAGARRRRGFLGAVAAGHEDQRQHREDRDKPQPTLAG